MGTANISKCKRHFRRISAPCMLKIRRYGFLSNPQKKTRLKLAQRLTRTKAPMFSDGKLSARELMLRVTGIDICRCRQCGGNLTSYNIRASPKGYNPIQSTSHSAPQNDRFFPVGRGILRTSGSLTTYRESTQHHFPEASCLFEGFCDGTNSIASRTAGRGFVHPAFCKKLFNLRRVSLHLAESIMPKRDTKMPQVNGDHLLHQQIVKRTREALQAQDEAFAIEHETASDADLIDYVRRCVDASYTSAPCEVVGGAYIAQRFGNWSAALKAAGLPSQYKPPRENGYPRFHEEYARQEAQLMQERREKRQAKADLVAQRKSRDKARAAANAAKAAEKGM